MTVEHTHWINGQWVSGQGDAFDSIDPARNEVVWQGKAATAEQIDDAMKAARTAFIS